MQQPGRRRLLMPAPIHPASPLCTNVRRCCTLIHNGGHRGKEGSSLEGRAASRVTRAAMYLHRLSPTTRTPSRKAWVGGDWEEADPSPPPGHPPWYKPCWSVEVLGSGDSSSPSSRPTARIPTPFSWIHPHWYTHRLIYGFQKPRAATVGQAELGTGRPDS